METPSTQPQLARQLFTAMLEAALPFKPGPDPEVTLEALIEAAAALKEHFEQELAELRQEQAE
jgi:hypothetical protein